MATLPNFGLQLANHLSDVAELHLHARYPPAVLNGSVGGRT